MNLPNSLTLGRIVLVPLLVVVLLTNIEVPFIFGVPREILAALIFTVASISDWLDGYLARRRRQVTTLGQLLDPVADKLLITAALVSLVQMELAPAWMVAVVIGRELLVTGLRSLAQTRGVTMPASPLGKLKMGAQVTTVLLLLVGQAASPFLLAAGRISLWVMITLALVSAVDYYRSFTRVMSPKVADFAAARERAQQKTTVPKAVRRR